MNIWWKSATHFHKRTLATAASSNQTEPQTSRDSDKPQPTPAELREEMRRSYGAYDKDSGKTAFGPFPPYRHPFRVKYSFDCRPMSPHRRNRYNRLPYREPNMNFWRNENVTVQYQQEPQSSVHLVIESLHTCIDNLSDLTKEHLPHLKEMAAVAESIICR